MTRILAAVVLVIAASPALACDLATHHAIKDAAWAQEKQAESLRQIERIERNRLKLLDRQQRNAR